MDFITDERVPIPSEIRVQAPAKSGHSKASIRTFFSGVDDKTSIEAGLFMAPRLACQARFQPYPPFPVGGTSDVSCVQSQLSTAPPRWGPTAPLPDSGYSMKHCTISAGMNPTHTTDHETGWTATRPAAHTLPSELWTGFADRPCPEPSVNHDSLPSA